MSRSFNKENFDIVIKGVSYFLKWSVRALYVLTGFVGLMTIVMIFLPKGLFDFDLANLEHINVNVMNVMYDLSNGGLSGVINVKWMITQAFFTGIMHLVFLLFILIKLRDVIQDVKEGYPFSYQNIIRLKHIGFAYIISAVVLPITDSWLFMSVFNQLDIFEANVDFSINLQAVFMGLIILILAYVFDYGANLQEDHDLTV